MTDDVHGFVAKGLTKSSKKHYPPKCIPIRLTGTGRVGSPKIARTQHASPADTCIAAASHPWPYQCGCLIMFGFWTPSVQKGTALSLKCNAAMRPQMTHSHSNMENDMTRSQRTSRDAAWSMVLFLIVLIFLFLLFLFLLIRQSCMLKWSGSTNLVVLWFHMSYGADESQHVKSLMSLLNYSSCTVCMSRLYISMCLICSFFRACYSYLYIS